MEKKEMQDLTRDYLKKIGFQVLKKTKFYYQNDSLVLRLCLEKSNFSELYYFTYHFRIKVLHPEINDITNDNVWDTFGGRLGYGNDRVFQVEYQLWNADTYLRELTMISEKQLVPIMYCGISYIKRLALDCESCGAWIVFKELDKQKILSLPE